MEFEFQESEVVFGDTDRIRKMPVREAAFRRSRPRSNAWMSCSPPVDIPGNNLRLRGFEEEEEYGDDDEREEMVPPHVIVDRKRIDGKVVGRPVCFGRGGTLKGRYLNQVRNSVLRLTGFLES